MNRFVKLVIPCLFLLSLTGCSKASNPWDKVEGGQLKVLVTFPPLYCFTKAVAGDDAKVQTLLSATGPHDHQATSADAHLAAGADLFLANGLTLDDFVTRVANASGNKKIQVVMVAEDALDKSKRLPMGKDAEGHVHGKWDPHVWLGIDEAILMVDKIRDLLGKADPSHAANYDQRAAEYVEKLKNLQAKGKAELKSQKDLKLIAMHESLGYFCKSFDLKLEGSIMPQPGVEADNAKLAELVKECKAKNIRVIAVEPQYSKERAETLRKNLKNSGHEMFTVEIDPMETAPRDALTPDYYLDVMGKNLENLQKIAEKLP